MQILLALAVAAVIYFLFRKRSRRIRVALSSSSPAVDRWLKEVLPGVLAVQLAKRGIDRAHVSSTLGGDPDPAVVSAIESAVKAIEIEYRRDPHLSDLEVKARVRFEDGEEENVSSRIPYAEAPASVRDDFEKKATSRAFRKWDFPWMAAR